MAHQMCFISAVSTGFRNPSFNDATHCSGDGKIFWLGGGGKIVSELILSWLPPPPTPIPLQCVGTFNRYITFIILWKVHLYRLWILMDLLPDKNTLILNKNKKGDISPRSPLVNMPLVLTMLQILRGYQCIFVFSPWPECHIKKSTFIRANPVLLLLILEWIHLLSD